MSVYDINFNKDNSTIRNVIVGVLATLNNKVYWYNWVGNQKVRVDIPFYFSTTGDERYLQDLFLNDITYDPDGKYAESAYNKIPRGIVNVESFSLESASFVNKFIRGEYEKEMEDGRLERYSTEFWMLPFTMNFDCTILVDSMLDQLKACEAIISKLFKNIVFYVVDSNGIKIPGTLSLSEDYSTERAVEFSFTDKKEWKISFSVECRSFLPVLKSDTPDTEIFAGKRMAYFYNSRIIVGENVVHLRPPIEGGTGATGFTPRLDTEEPWVNRIFVDSGFTGELGRRDTGLNFNFENYAGYPFGPTGPWPIGVTQGEVYPSPTQS